MDRGQEIRELKLGATFTNPNARTVYHTIKYDFKPASVDVHKEATLATGSNNSVTVTVPHLDGSGVPNTIFKGNQRDYTKKECVLIFNRETNEIILEKLSSNIQVKKTRTDQSSKQQQQPPPPILHNAKISENQTQRHSSKTRVSTGIRKNILNYVPKHSPLQGSPSYPHKSPQQAPAWNANNNTSTLPSITSLLDDNNFANSQPSSVYNSNSKNSSNNIISSNNLSSSSTSVGNPMMMQPKSSSSAMSSQQHQQQQQLQQQQQQMTAVDDIGVLSSSESSSDSNDDSDSDSDDSADSDNDNQHHPMSNSNSNSHSMVNHNSSNSNHKKAPTTSITSMGNHLDNSSKAALLTKDLCLSDSNSDSDF